MASSFTHGWIKTDKLVFVNQELYSYWINNEWCAIVDDDVTIFDMEGVYLTSMDIGSYLPVAEEKEDYFKVVIASGVADCKFGFISKQKAKMIPIPFLPVNIARLLQPMIGQPYGWGGCYRMRDCSSMLMDLYVPFGYAFPRNGKEQVNACRTVKDVSGYCEKEKKNYLLMNALPFYTFLWFSGHIMLYVGAYKNDPVVVHNIWALRTKTKKGIEGRLRIGYCCFTSLLPGIENPLVDSSKSLLKRLTSVSTIIDKTWR